MLKKNSQYLTPKLAVAQHKIVDYTTDGTE